MKIINQKLDEALNDGKTLKKVEDKAVQKAQEIIESKWWLGNKMIFESNEAQAVFVYFPFDVPNQWDCHQKEYYDEGDLIRINFDFVVESYFTRDFLDGKFTAFDQAAKDWALPLVELITEAH